MITKLKGCGKRINIIKIKTKEFKGSEVFAVCGCSCQGCKGNLCTKCKK